MNELQLLKKEIEDIKNWKRSLEMSHSIPLNIDQSFRARFKNIGGSAIEQSTKSATSENRTVNESGSATYDVLKAPDTFIQTLVNGTIIYIPAFN